MPRLRVMAFNVHGFRSGMRQVAAAIAAESPDVALLNEVRYLWPPLGRLGRRLGMDVASGRRLRRPIPNAVLVRPPWRIVERGVAEFARTGRTLRRGMVVTVIGRAGTRVEATSVHLGLSEGERARHARELTDLLAARREWVVVGGDLNEGPDGRAASWIGERYWDAHAAAGSGEGHTFPASVPRARIDYVFVSDGITVERTWVPQTGAASDHLPVVADLLVGE